MGLDALVWHLTETPKASFRFGCINRVYSRFLPYFLVGIFVSRAAVPLLRGFWRVGVDLVERGNEGLGVLEIRGQPHPGLLQ